MSECEPKPLHGGIAGQVTDLSGHPLSEVAVLIVKGADHPDIAAITDSSGRFSFDELRSVTYMVQAVSGMHGAVTGSVRVRQGKTARLNLKIPG